MRVVPQKAIEKVQFYQDRISPWTTSATAIGTTATEVGDLDTKTQLARTKYNAQQVLKGQLKAATQAFYAAADSMGIAGASIMKQIRAKGEATGDPNVYELAVIPAPATPEPKPAPGTPGNMSATLDGNGSLILKWKCANPAGTSGTMYQMYRSIGGSTVFTYLGGAGSKLFTDATIPAGATQITYKIQAVRSTAAGMWATFNVLFGSNTGVTSIASVTEGAASNKLAA